MRLVEAYVATRDAVGYIVSATLAPKGRRIREPKLWYLELEGASRPAGLTGAELEAAVDRFDQRIRGGNVGSRVKVH